jgi:hypothetical protein
MRTGLPATSLAVRSSARESVDRMGYKDASTKQSQDYCDRFNHFHAPLFYYCVRLITANRRNGFVPVLFAAGIIVDGKKGELAQRVGPPRLLASEGQRLAATGVIKSDRQIRHREEKKHGPAASKWRTTGNHAGHGSLGPKYQPPWHTALDSTSRPLTAPTAAACVPQRRPSHCFQRLAGMVLL